MLTSRKLAGAAGSFGTEVVFKQLVDDDLGCASYLIGDETAGEAVVVDPAYAIEPYLDAAEQAGVRIVRVLETHNHADHVSGHGRFALEHGLPVSIHPLGRPEYAFDPLTDSTPSSVPDGTWGWHTHYESSGNRRMPHRLPTARYIPARPSGSPTGN